MRNGLVALAAAVVAGALAPGVASADLPISAMSAQPASTQAGGHSDFNLSLTFGGTENVRSLVIHLPAGVIGNPTAATPCALSDFRKAAATDANTCPAASVVGSTTVDATATVLFLPVPITAQGKVYVLQPGNGETARLGIEVSPTGAAALLGQHIRLESPVSLRKDGGLDSSLADIPQTAAGLPLRINAMALTLNATQADTGKSFITLPTSCAAARTTVDAASYETPGSTTTRSDSFTPTGCSNVPFTPGVQATVDTGRVSSTTGVTVALTVPAAENPIRQSHIRRTDVVLPVGMGLNPGLAATVSACSDAQFDVDSQGPSSCPASAQIGTVRLDTPVLGPVDGVVYLGAPTPQALLRVFVLVENPARGLRVKLAGTNTLDPDTGQVTATFDGLPQIPFTRFELKFAGGDHSVLTTPPTCGPATTTARLVPYSGAATATVTSTFQVSADGAGAPCGDGQPFNPRLTASVEPSTAGAATTNAVTLSRNDGDQLLRDVTVSMPPGLAGSLKGVPFCDETLAKAGMCPADTQVGVVQAQAGVGNAPLVLDGRVYLVGPGDGALARLAIVLPGAVGPFDFGSVVSFAALGIRPADGGLDVVTRNLPTTLQGIPLNLRQLTLTLNRPGFARNATSCAAQQIHATFTSTRDAVASSDAPYQATGCDRLPYAPKVTLTASGAVGRGGRPVLKAAVTQDEGQSASKRVSVALPPALGNELLHTDRQSCSIEAAAANACPEKSRIGTARAETSLLPIPLTGDVLLVNSAVGLPKLSITLAPLGLTVTGQITIDKQGRLVNTFDNLPDTPLTNFELSFNGGTAGILATNKDLCTTKGKGEGQFLGHSGATATTVATLKVEGCKGATAKKPTARAVFRRFGTRASTLTLQVKAAKGGRKLRRIRFAVPRRVSLHALRKGRYTVSPKGARVRRIGRATVEVRAPRKAGAASIRLVLKARALKVTRKSRRAFTVAAYDTAGKKVKIKVTAGKKR